MKVFWEIDHEHDDAGDDYDSINTRVGWNMEEVARLVAAFRLLSVTHRQKRARGWREFVYQISLQPLISDTLVECFLPVTNFGLLQGH